ncbi:MAG TPA: glycerophosphodiester phosphodiesterase family protein [Anaeromyxobacteraceae bacterium]|nr:glycerophosphodiester phosphodiesterase family protein [Anaeromyxobacteraceae bacterium]
MTRAPPRAPRAEGRPLVLGHRGASADAPENTLAAFRLALAQGADGVELDVWRCATGEIVVCHDEDARRVAGSALRVADAPLQALRALDVGAWRGERFRGERLPLLDEALDALPGAVVNVEMKSRGGDPRLAGALAALLERRGDGGRVVVSSFDWRLLRAFRRAAPGVAVGLLLERSTAWRLRLAVEIARLRPEAVHPHRRLVTGARARAWGRRGLAVNVWTVDAPEEAERLCALGAAGIVTNAPGRIREAVRRATGR